MSLSRHQIRDAWTGWLAQRPWDLFLTLTSEKRAHPESLHKRFRYVVHSVSNVVYGRGATRRGRSPVEWVNGIERHKSGWPHSHALIRLPQVDLSDQVQFNLGYWQEWISGTGGWCWLSRPRDNVDVTRYVTKYVTKEGELIFSPNLCPGSNPNPPLKLTIR